MANTEHHCPACEANMQAFALRRVDYLGPQHSAALARAAALDPYHAGCAVAQDRADCWLPEVTR